MPRRHRLVIADDHKLVLEAFTNLLSTAYEVVAAVADGQSLVRATLAHAPDVVLVDITMPQLNGLDAIERLKAERPRVRVIVLTMEEDADTAAEAIRRGASGYVLKSSESSELFAAIEAALNGRVFISPAVARGPSEHFVAAVERGARGTALTLRQREVLQLLAEGMSMKQAADRLGVTTRTIAFHKYSIMEQLGLKTSAELVQHAVVLGLVARHRMPSSS
jgi:DNA-binding NarL/FixJ family response regulator